MQAPKSLRMTTGNLITFLGAALLLAAIPGPGMLFVLARSLAHGRRAGLQSAAGTAIGGSIHAVAAALGLSAIIAASSQAYAALRWIGAAYLVYLGARTLLERDERRPDAAPSAQHALRSGIVTEVLNPKTAVFFLAFIPPFVPAGHPVATSVWFLTLGMTSVTLNTLADLVAVFAATALLRDVLASPVFTRWRKRGAGVTLIGMGIVAVAHERPR